MKIMALEKSTNRCRMMWLDLECKNNEREIWTHEKKGGKNVDVVGILFLIRIMSSNPLAI